MVRLLSVLVVLAVVSCTLAAPNALDVRPGISTSVTASEGSFGIGHINGGTFGESSFSIGHGGKSTGSGPAGHGGNHGTNSYGGPGGDGGNTRYS